MMNITQIILAGLLLFAGLLVIVARLLRYAGDESLEPEKFEYYKPKVSDCCNAQIRHGLCMACLEHCEAIEEEGE
jgi:hypothetical protein